MNARAPEQLEPQLLALRRFGDTRGLGDRIF
jgi:hypothetical protein